ncbi:MAG: hypothetical protein EOP56_06620 [Sphingobacteriales bacterium]|nr:MAG: hypothetical protein EOP56_06620 [Sphingobacteriales bacterium]
MKATETRYDPNNNLVTTTLSGFVNSEDVEQWKQSLSDTLDSLPENGGFKIFVNLHGFKAENFDVHKQFRNVIPLTLADYGFRAGYVEMFENVDLPLQNKRGIKCLAAAHCHQDETKIANYQQQFSKPNEQFFTDPLAAANWISKLQVS